MQIRSKTERDHNPKLFAAIKQCGLPPANRAGLHTSIADDVERFR
jgi:hypothetical protein